MLYTTNPKFVRFLNNHLPIHLQRFLDENRDCQAIVDCCADYIAKIDPPTESEFKVTVRPKVSSLIQSALRYAQQAQDAAHMADTACDNLSRILVEIDDLRRETE